MYMCERGTGNGLTAFKISGMSASNMKLIPMNVIRTISVQWMIIFISWPTIKRRDRRNRRNATDVYLCKLSWLVFLFASIQRVFSFLFHHWSSTNFWRYHCTRISSKTKKNIQMTRLELQLFLSWEISFILGILFTLSSAMTNVKCFKKAATNIKKMTICSISLSKSLMWTITPMNWIEKKKEWILHKGIIDRTEFQYLHEVHWTETIALSRLL